MSCVKNDSLSSSFPICLPLMSFSYFIALASARTSSTLNQVLKAVERWDMVALHLILVGNHQFFSLLSMMFGRLFVDSLYQIKEVLLCAYFAEIFFFIMNECQILSGAFSASFNRIYDFFFLT